MGVARNTQPFGAVADLTRVWLLPQESVKLKENRNFGLLI